MSSSKIPKVISFFWSGEPISWLRSLSIISARKLNPDWEINLYVNPNVEDYPSASRKSYGRHQNIKHYLSYYTGENFLREIEKHNVNIISLNSSLYSDINTIRDQYTKMEMPFFPVQSSVIHRKDILQWFLLATKGGIFADMDILFIQPMDRVFTEDRKSTEALMVYENGYFSMGLIASSPNNKLFRDVYIHALENFTLGKYESTGITSLRNSLLPHPPNWDSIAVKYPEMKVDCLPTGYLYPFKAADVYRYFGADNLDISTEQVQDSIGLHWYGGNPIAQSWNNILSPDNYLEYPGVITRFIHKIIS